MTTAQQDTTTAARTSAAPALEATLEVTTLPVSDVDRAKAFYERLGWRRPSWHWPAPPACSWPARRPRPRR